MNRVNVLLMLAWRNLWRNHRRTFIMLSAISIGVWAMIFMTALTQGMVNEMIKDGIRELPGHVQVHNPAYRDDPNVNNLLPRTDAEIYEAFEGVDLEIWASRVKVPAVITSERDSRGITLVGINPERERDLTFVDYDDVDGRFLDTVDDNGVVIGAKLASILETEVGKRVVLMSQDPNNEIADRGFRIVGLFRANLEANEEAYVFAGKRTIQKMLGIGDHVTEVVALGDSYRNVEPVYEKVVAAAGDGVVVERWTDLNSYLGTMLSFMDGFVLIWVIVIFLALSFGLVNTLVMAVFERVREIGLMLALGMQPGNILGQIIIESMLLLAIGLAIGNVFAIGSVALVQDGIDISIVGQGMEMMGASGLLIPQMRTEDVVLANIVVLVLGFLASLSPAWRASRYEPIEAITKVD